MPVRGSLFILDTDASNTGIASILSQIQNGTERVIAYSSRILSQSERNYSVTKRELLAIVYGLKQYRQYLLGLPSFLIRTDHAPLTYLLRTPDLVGQEARWLNLIQEYSFEVKHRAGSNHNNADALSRRPDETITSAFLRKVNTPQTPILAGENLSELQQKDSNWGMLATLLLSGAEPPRAEDCLIQHPEYKQVLAQLNGRKWYYIPQFLPHRWTTTIASTIANRYSRKIRPRTTQ